ncbi:phytoene desaturase family protein [bacterium]|nr:phytoene desaturase family protein [bacterium]MDB4725243.1 phytoene desaturase family protein [Akkermansiaceae bacterium]
MNRASMSEQEKVVIVGAGPGGLSSAMILANRGFDVTVVEKADRVGGRTAELNVGDYSFDTGPTFLHQKFTLDEIFAETGRDSADYIDFVALDPMTRLSWGDVSIETSSDGDTMAKRIAEVFPGDEVGYRRFIADHADKLNKIYPCLQQPYHKVKAYFTKDIARVFPYIATSKSVVDVLDTYFSDDRLKLAFTFQAKYLGMSPWKCPALFSILSYIEYKYGIYHVQGGLNKIPVGMAKAATEDGAKIRLNSGVKEVLFDGSTTKGVLLENGETLQADHVIMNSDFAHSMVHLMNGASKPEAEMSKKKYSCSTFMLYLGLDKLYEDEPHHHVMFADDYQRNVDEVRGEKEVSQDMSIYVRNSSVTDPAVAPKGHSQLYVLVPTINCRHGHDWEETKKEYRDAVIKRIEERTGMKDLSDHIVAERILTPNDWRDEGDIFMGATFNLAHTMDQMLYFRPHNKMKGYDNLYLVGGGTHPGSGLPTIFESGRISSNLVCDAAGVSYDRVDLATDILAQA